MHAHRRGPETSAPLTSGRHNQRRCVRACALTLRSFPEGLELYHPAGDISVEFVAREVFRNRCYLQPPIQLRKGDAVIDCGANSGFFSVLAAREVGPNGLVVSLEPARAAFEALQANTRRHSGSGGAGLIIPIKAAISDGSEATLRLREFNRVSGWSSLAPDSEEVVSATSEYLTGGGRSAAAGDLGFLGGLGQAVLTAAPKPLVKFVGGLAIRALLSDYEDVLVPCLTVSAVLRDHRPAGPIGLLKLDIERAELAGLRGVAGQDWGRIRQVVAEVHAQNLPGVLEVLQGPGGFAPSEIVVGEDEALRGTGLYHVAAARG